MRRSSRMVQLMPFPFSLQSIKIKMIMTERFKSKQISSSSEPKKLEDLSPKHHRSPNDPMQDSIDMKEHRYHSGYWVTKWDKKGRLVPFRESMRKTNLSSFDLNSH
jgi:hypothetical protein